MDWIVDDDDDLFNFESKKRSRGDDDELSFLFTEEDIVNGGIDARTFVLEFPHITGDDIWRKFLERDMPDEWIACGGQLPLFAASWKHYYVRLRWMYVTHVNDWILFQNSSNAEAFRNALQTQRGRAPLAFQECYRRYREAFSAEVIKNHNNVKVNPLKNDMAGNMISCRLARLKSQLVKTFFRGKGLNRVIFSEAVRNDLESVLNFVRQNKGGDAAEWFVRAAFHVVLSGSIIVEWVFWENDQSDSVYHNGIMFRKHPDFGWGACVLMYAPVRTWVNAKKNNWPKGPWPKGPWPKVKSTLTAFSQMPLKSNGAVEIVEKKSL